MPFGPVLFYFPFRLSATLQGRKTSCVPFSYSLDAAAEVELRDGLPFIQLVIVDAELFDRYYLGM